MIASKHTASEIQCLGQQADGLPKKTNFKQHESISTLTILYVQPINKSCGKNDTTHILGINIWIGSGMFLNVPALLSESRHTLQLPANCRLGYNDIVPWEFEN